VISDECKPLAGTDGDECIHALWTGAGLLGATGADPTWVYTPATSATYLTIKLWAGDHSWIFQDCLANVTIDLTPGGIGVATFSFEVGSLKTQADGETFPTVTYGTQTSLSAPIVQGSGTHVWDSGADADGAAKGLNSYSLSINNNLEKVPDSNQATGERVVLASRDITLASTVWVEAADTDFEYEELIKTTISTVTGTVQVGTVAVADAVINAYKIEMETPEVTSLKYNKIGDKLVAETTQTAVAASAGAEFTLTFN